MNQFLAALILACPALTILSITLPPSTIIAYIVPPAKACTPPIPNPTPSQRPSCTEIVTP